MQGGWGGRSWILSLAFWGRKYDEGPPLAFCIFATSVFACGSREPRPSRLSKPDRCSKSKLTPNMEGANARHGPCYRPRRRSEPAFACCCLHTGKGTVGMEWKYRRWFTPKIPFRSLSFFFRPLLPLRCRVPCPSLQGPSHESARSCPVSLAAVSTLRDEPVAAP